MANQPPRSRPRDLDGTIDRVPVRNDEGDVVGHRDVSIIERVAEAIRTGANVQDAANRVGMDERTLRGLRSEGIRHWEAHYAGKLKHPRGVVDQKMRLARQMALAETEAKLALLATAGRLAHGGIVRTEEQEETDGATGLLIKRVKKTSTLLPDPGMVRWLLERRWASEFNRSRIELAGSLDVEVNVSADDAIDKLRGMLSGIAENRARSAPVHAGNGETGNGES